tara:strand:- start:14825 stop:15472 length:648 start_codon:yes stop_codon:yes gene_type:complete
MIPKVIYMCHKKTDDIKIYSKNWEKLNPDWKINLYDDKSCQDFLFREYGQLYLDIFNYIKDGPIKSDFWRLCILYKYGGLYIDADIEPILPLNKYIEDDDYFVTCISRLPPKSHLNPHFILSYKNNFLLNECIEKYKEMYINKIKYKYWKWSIVHVMNNTLFKRIIKEKKSQIIVDNDKKYKFLFEKSLNETEFLNKLVFYNRYKNYIDHDFTNN